MDSGLVVMSRREIERAHAMRAIHERRLTQTQAASQLSLSVRQVERPKVGFKDHLPQSLTLPLAPPPCFADQSQYLSALRALVGSRLKALHEERARQGRRVLGRRAVRKTAVTERPMTRKKRFGLSPTFSALTRQAWRQAVKRLRGFRAAYRRAYEAWRSENRNVEFPAGT